MARVGCPNCLYPVEFDPHSPATERNLLCPRCGHSFEAASGIEQHGETAVLQREKPRNGAVLDIALVGHLRVSGSLGLEAPTALRPGKTVVGRQAADMVVADETLSGRHFEIENREGKFLIRDLGSTNGTHVNGELLNQTSQLRNGDRIRAGKTTFVFRTLETIPWNPSTNDRSEP